MVNIFGQMAIFIKEISSMDRDRERVLFEQQMDKSTMANSKMI
jgi:hypothetical protein